MDITAIHKELRALLMLAERWGEQGYTPAVERDIALGRVRNLYDSMLEMEIKAAQMEPQSEILEQKTAQIIDILAGRISEQDEEEIEEEEEEEVEEEVEVAEEVEEEVKEEVEVEEEIEEEEEEEKEQEPDEQQKRRFIHDLFCNDETFYDQEMAKLSVLDTMDDVLIYIGEKYAWVPDSQSAQEFVELQYKRFGSI